MKSQVFLPTRKAQLCTDPKKLDNILENFSHKKIPYEYI